MILWICHHHLKHSTHRWRSYFCNFRRFLLHHLAYLSPVLMIMWFPCWKAATQSRWNHIVTHTAIRTNWNYGTGNARPGHHTT
jgi:hypothetical protein